MGLGHRLRRDDAFGSILADELAQSLSPNSRWRAVDCSTTPENYIKPAAEFSPDKILFIDALQGEGSPGKIEIIEFDELELSGFSTHTFSPAFLKEQFQQRTGAKLFVLGVYVNSTKVGSGLSERLKETKKELKDFFREKLQE